MKMGVIGCGYWGPNLIRVIYQLPEFMEVICCDLDPERLDRMRRLFPYIQTTSDVEDVLSDDAVAAVAVATPVRLHHELGELVLQRGKHLFVEKPLANSVANCRRLIDIAARNNKVLMVGHTFEYTAAVNKMKEIIDSGELGEILYVSGIRVNLGLFQPDINVVWDLAPHDLSILNFILDRTPVSVNCRGLAHFRAGIEDVASLTLDYGDNLISFVHVSWLDPKKIRRTTVVGTNKMLVYDDIQTQEKIKIYDKGVDAPPYYDTFAEFQFSYRYGDIHIPKLDDYEPLKKEMHHFYECIRNGATPRSDGHSGLRVVSILEAAQASIKNKGAPAPVHPDLSDRPHAEPAVSLPVPERAYR